MGKKVRREGEGVRGKRERGKSEGLLEIDD
jgi:hypothetical protein